jgi:GT2 family glycosyltransferase
MDTHTDTGVLQPKIMMHDKPSLLWDGGSYYNKWLGYAYTSGYGQLPRSKHNRIKAVDWVTGCGFFVRNSILRQTGLLDDHFFMYYEDVDLSLRIRQLGHSLMYHPDAVIYHVAGASANKTTKTSEGVLNPMVHYWNVRNRIWVLKKHTTALYLPTVVIFNFFRILALMLYFVARRRFKKLKMVCKAVKDGLKRPAKHSVA